MFGELKSIHEAITTPARDTNLALCMGDLLAKQRGVLRTLNGFDLVVHKSRAVSYFCTSRELRSTT